MIRDILLETLIFGKADPTLLGYSQCLQYPMEYEYLYEGIVTTGFPTVSGQGAKAAISSNLILQVRSKTVIVAKLNNIKVYTAHEFSNHTTNEKPYHRLTQDIEEALLTPFAFHPSSIEGETLIVAANESLWVTNMRKAIVQSFITHTAKNTLEYSNDPYLSDKIFNSSGFYIMEDTIFGKCQSMYTINKYFEKSKHTSYKNEDEYFQVVRTIDFDVCDDRVSLQHAGMSDTTKSTTEHFGGVGSRSSIATYIFLKSKNGTIALAQATIEGSVTRNPLGIGFFAATATTQKVFENNRRQCYHAIFEFLTLQKISKIKKLINLPENKKFLKTWSYGVLSPFSSPSTVPSLPWVNYTSDGDNFAPISNSYVLLGLKDDAVRLEIEFNRHFEDGVNNVHKHGTIIWSESGYSFLIASKLFRNFPMNYVEKIFNKTLADTTDQAKLKRSSLVFVAAASGGTAPMKHMIDLVLQKKLNYEEIGLVLFSMANQISNPYILRYILKFVSSIDFVWHNLAKTAGLLNFARTANRICLSPHYQKFASAHQIFGDACENFKSDGEDKFINYLKSMYENPLIEMEEDLAIEALSYFGSLKTINFFKNLVWTSGDNRLRTAALYALTPKRLPYDKKEELVSFHMTVAENPDEIDEVVMTAIACAWAWNPGAAWLNRIAKFSWQTKSHQVSGFIYSILQNLHHAEGPKFNDMSEAASLALTLTKSVYPTRQDSISQFYLLFQNKFKVQSLTGAAQLLDKTFGHGDLNVVLAGTISDYLLSLIEVSILSVTHRNTSDSSNHQQNSDRFEPADLSIRLFENMVAYIPRAGPAWVSNSSDYDEFGNLKHLLGDVQPMPVIFTNILQNEFFVPTELGLPLIGSMDLGLVLGADVSSNHPNNTKDSQNRGLRAQSHFLTQLKVLIPWTSGAIETGIKNTKALNLPADFHFKSDKSDEFRNWTISTFSEISESTWLFNAENRPYTALYSLRQGTSENDLHTVHTCSKPLVKLRMKKLSNFQNSMKIGKNWVGLDAKLDFVGDAAYPHTTSTVKECLIQPIDCILPLISGSEYWKTSLFLKPEENSSSKFSASASLISSISNSDMSKMNSEDVNFSLEDSQIERRRKFRDYGISTALNLKFKSSGKLVNKYELVISKNPSIPEDLLSPDLFHVSILSSSINSSKVHDTKNEAFCVSMKLFNEDVPLSPHESPNDSNMLKIVEGSVRYGENCTQESTIASMKGSFTTGSMRNDAKHCLRRNMSKDSSKEKTNRGIFEINYKQKKTPQIVKDILQEINQYFMSTQYPFVKKYLFHESSRGTEYQTMSIAVQGTIKLSYLQSYEVQGIGRHDSDKYSDVILNTTSGSWKFTRMDTSTLFGWFSSHHDTGGKTRN